MEHPNNRRNETPLRISARLFSLRNAMVLLTAFYLAAFQTRTLRAAPAPDSPAPVPPWVWKVQPSRGPEIFVAGVLHLGCDEDAGAFPLYLPVYKQCATIYLESSPLSWESYDAKRLLGLEGLLADRVSLRYVIGPATWGELAAFFQSDPEELAAIDRMKPWLAALKVTQESYSRAGLDRTNSLEYFLLNLAAADHKPVGALETPKEEISALSDAPLDQQKLMLLSALREDPENVRKLDAAWRTGDAAALESILRASAANSPPEVQDRIIAARNRNWLKSFRLIIRRGKTALVLVGIEHLVDPRDGLLALLRQSGCSIEPALPN